MKSRTILFAALVAFFVTSASAENIKLKFQDLAELGSALKGLDGLEKEVQTSDQGKRIIRVPFDLKPAARIAIAKDLTAVRGALDAFEQQRQVLLQRVSPGAIEKVQTDIVLLGKFSELWNAFVKEPITIDVTFLTEEQLNLDSNKEIVGSMLAGLTPILKVPSK